MFGIETGLTGGSMICLWLEPAAAWGARLSLGEE